MKTLITLLMAVMLFGCGSDKMGCYEAVVKDAGAEADVRPIPGLYYRYLVIYPNCEIWVYATNNLTDTNVSFKARVK